MVLDMGPEESPWVGRSTVQVRGCSKQLDAYNFIHTLLDNRWCGYCKSTGQDLFTAIPHEEFFTNLRRSYSHQMSKGQLVIIGCTLAYWHCEDRTATPVELLRYQGWGTDVDVSKCGLPVPFLEKGKKKKTQVDPVEEAAQDPETARKRRRKINFKKLPCPDAKVMEMAGQAMCLPDVLSVFYCMQLACDTGVFSKKAPDLPQIVELMGMSNPAQVFNQAQNVPVVVDLEANPGDLVNLFGLEEQDLDGEDTMETHEHGSGDDS